MKFLCLTKEGELEIFGFLTLDIVFKEDKYGRFCSDVDFAYNDFMKRGLVVIEDWPDPEADKKFKDMCEAVSKLEKRLDELRGAR